MTHTETNESVLERIAKADSIKKEDIAVECCVCHKYKDKNNEWRLPSYCERYNILRSKLVSHTYCEDCYKKIINEVSKK